MKSVAVLVLCFASVSFAFLVGGWSNRDVNDGTIKTIAEQIVDIHNQIGNNLYFKKMVEVVSAKSQVVAGSNYEVTVRIGETHCAKSDPGAKNCEVDANAITEICVFRAHKSLQDVLTITSVSCTQG